LNTLLNSERSTSHAEPFHTYEAPLCVFVEDSLCESLRGREMRYGILLD
jgi:hypothetical protein